MILKNKNVEILQCKFLIITNTSECTPEYTNTVNKPNERQIRYKCTPAAEHYTHCIQQNLEPFNTSIHFTRTRV